jgi:lysophospholipase L1-like esterase
LGLVRPSSTPDVVFELKPNLDGVFLGKPMMTNSHGMRGPEVAGAKTPGTRRIIGLGDSVMFGWGVAYDNSYLGILASELGSLHAPVEVCNFAVPGYNTAMQVAAFESKALEFDPDLVLLHVVNNDFDLPRFLLEPRRVWALDRCYLYDLVRRASQGEREGAWLQPKDLDGLDPARRQKVQERYRHLVGPEAFLNAIRKLADLCGSRGIPVLVIVRNCSGEMWSLVCETATGHGFELLALNPIFARHLAELRPDPTRKAWIETFWLAPNDPHPNELGHSLIAEAIMRQLAESKQITIRMSDLRG